MTGVHASFRARSLLGVITQSLVSQGAASSTLRIAKIWARIGQYGSGRLSARQFASLNNSAIHRPLLG
jgi:hypothetical protein